MFVENYFLDYLKIISIGMPRIIMNSIVRRSSSKIDLNNEISLLECVKKSILHLFEKSKATPRWYSM